MRCKLLRQVLAIIQPLNLIRTNPNVLVNNFDPKRALLAKGAIQNCGGMPAITI